MLGILGCLSWVKIHQEQVCQCDPRPAVSGHCGNAVAITDAITFKGQDLFLKTIIIDGVTYPNPTESTYYGSSVLRENFTFTSPTIYIAHHPMTMTVNSMSGDGEATTAMRIRPAGVFAVHPKDVFSFRPRNRNIGGGLKYAQLVAKGNFEPDQYAIGYDETVSFDFGHLRNPVPASVYFEARTDCWHKASHCATITDDSYRPQLAIRNHVWQSIIPKQLGCYRPRLVDPPIVLSPIRHSQ